MGPLLLGRILSAPFVAAAIALCAAAMIEPLIFLLPAQPARIERLWSQFKARRGTFYFATYRLERSGFEAVDELMPAEYFSLRIGQRVQAHALHLGSVGYSALHRSVAAYARSRVGLWVNAAFALPIGLLLFHAIWLMPWRTLWLVKHGQATFGAVVQKSVIFGVGGRRQMFFTLTYQFKAFNVLRARKISIHPQRYDSAGVKDLVVVLFDPRCPSRNIVYDYCNFVAI